MFMISMKAEDDWSLISMEADIPTITMLLSYYSDFHI